MNRTEAEIKLKRIFGFDNFYDEQWETIEIIVPLVIAKTVGGDIKYE
ncbi:MAG: hypothetical protein U9R19_16975 [Bacteroidota bacterium]|nr:hypothetical protein [Bacteroidota bacterium]